MCSYGYFYQGNAKQTRTTLKNINFVLLRMSKKYLIRLAYRIDYRVPSSEPHFFLRWGGGGVGWGLI